MQHIFFNALSSQKGLLLVAAFVFEGLALNLLPRL
jgi:hypothetical protein